MLEEESVYEAALEIRACLEDYWCISDTWPELNHHDEPFPDDENVLPQLDGFGYAWSVEENAEMYYTPRSSLSELDMHVLHL